MAKETTTTEPVKLEQSKAKAECCYLPEMINVSEFAAHCETTRTTVYRAIIDGRIVPVLVGKNKHIYIDVNKYGDTPFKKYTKTT